MRTLLASEMDEFIENMNEDEHDELFYLINDPDIEVIDDEDELDDKGIYINCKMRKNNIFYTFTIENPVFGDDPIFSGKLMDSLLMVIPDKDNINEDNDIVIYLDGNINNIISKISNINIIDNSNGSVILSLTFKKVDTNFNRQHVSSQQNLICHVNSSDMDNFKNDITLQQILCIRDHIQHHPIDVDIHFY